MLFTCRESTKSLMFRPYLSSVILAEVCYFCLEKKEKTKKERGKVELKFFNNFPFVFPSVFLFFFCFFVFSKKILNYSPWLKIQRGLAYNLIISIHLRGGVTFFYTSCSCCVPSRPKHSVTKSCVVRRKGASSVNYV